MLTAYVDDSGNSELPVFVLAGFISTPLRWKDFSHEWRAVLDMTPRLHYFKGGEAFNLRGAFHGWTEADRDARVLRLVEVIRTHAVAGLITIFPYEAPIGILKPSKKGNHFNDSQLLNFVSLLSFLKSDDYGEPRQKLQLVLDKGIFKGSAKRAFANTGLFELANKLSGTTRNDLQWPPDEKDDLEVLPLQAADMFAWIFRNIAKRFWNDEPELPIVDRIMAATSPLPIRIVPWDQKMVQRFSPHSRIGRMDKWNAAVAGMKINRS